MNIALRMLSDSANVIKRIQGLATAKDQLGDPDYWGSVGILTITGIMVVFLILAILIFFFWLMGTIFKAIDKSKAEKKAVAAVPTETASVETASVETASVETASVELTEEELDETDDLEIVAVISAAVAAYAEAEGTAYTIKSISRHKDSARSVWGAAGISRNMRQF